MQSSKSAKVRVAPILGTCGDARPCRLAIGKVLGDPPPTPEMTLVERDAMTIIRLECAQPACPVGQGAGVGPAPVSDREIPHEILGHGLGGPAFSPAGAGLRGMRASRIGRSPGADWVPGEAARPAGPAWRSDPQVGPRQATALVGRQLSVTPSSNDIAFATAAGVGSPSGRPLPPPPLAVRAAGWVGGVGCRLSVTCRSARTIAPSGLCGVVRCADQGAGCSYSRPLLAGVGRVVRRRVSGLPCLAACPATEASIFMRSARCLCCLALMARLPRTPGDITLRAVSTQMPSAPAYFKYACGTRTPALVAPLPSARTGGIRTPPVAGCPDPPRAGPGQARAGARAWGLGLEPPCAAPGSSPCSPRRARRRPGRRGYIN